MPALLYEKRDGIAYITFNRPEVHNAWNPEVFCRLAGAWADFAGDNSLGVAFMTGGGEKARGVGLVNYVVPAAEVIPKAEEFARKLAANGPVALRAIKEAVIRTSG